MTMTYTKKQLETDAKALGITGRSKMSKDELFLAITKLQSEDQGFLPADAVKATKKRKPSSAPRNDEGKVIRVGVNLSGNQPFARKHYYIDAKFADFSSWTEEYAEAVNAAPNQVKLILKTMRTLELNNPDNAMQGGAIVQHAIDNGIIATKIKPNALFAYYRRLMETLGVRLA